MKKIVALMFLAAIISAAPSFAQQVKLDVEKETIPTHQIGAPEVNPIFFTGRVYQGAEGYIYPYPLYDVITDKVVDKTYEIVKPEPAPEPDPVIEEDTVVINGVTYTKAQLREMLGE